MSELDYVKVVGRLGIVLRDSASDPDLLRIRFGVTKEPFGSPRSSAPPRSST